MKVAKQERLANLVAALLATHQPMSLWEINEKVNGYIGLKHEAARRQMDRDKKELQLIGVEVELTTVPHTNPPKPGYKIAPQKYYLKDLNLSSEELAAINLAKQLINLGNETMDMAIYKLGGAESTGLENAELNRLVWLPPLDEIHPINRAILGKSVMHFKYLSEKGELTKRNLEPLKIYSLAGHWHVSGYDRTRDGIRNFRIDRIQGKIKFADDGDFHSVSDSAANLNPWEYATDATEPFTARLWVDKDNADWAEMQMGKSAKTLVNSDGSKTFELQINSPEHFYRFVANFNQSAEIEGEKSLREGFIKYLKAVV